MVARRRPLSRVRTSSRSAPERPEIRDSESAWLAQVGEPRGQRMHPADRARRSPPSRSKRVAPPRRAEVAPARRAATPARRSRSPGPSSPTRRRAQRRRTPSGGASQRPASQPSNARSIEPPPPRPPAAPRSSGSTRASTGRSRSRSAQKPWMVPMRASSRCASARLRAARARTLPGVCPRARFLELGAQPQLHLAGRLLGEGDARRAGRTVAPPRGQHVTRRADQLGGLAGAGGGLDDEGGVEDVADALALGRVDQRGSQRAPQRPQRLEPAAGPCACTRFSSCGPHTARKSQYMHARWRGAAGRKPTSIARSISPDHLRRHGARACLGHRHDALREAAGCACSSRGATRTTLAAEQLLQREPVEHRLEHLAAAHDHVSLACVARPSCSR